MKSRRWRLAAGLLPLLLCACGTYGPRIDAVGPRGRLAPEARYVLESHDGNEASISIIADARLDDWIDEHRTDTVAFLFTLDNASDEPVTIATGGMVVTDNGGRTLRRLGTNVPPGFSPEELTLPPHQRATIEILFDVGGSGLLGQTRALTLSWGYRYRGVGFDHRTRFIPRYFGPDAGRDYPPSPYPYSGPY